MTVSTKCFYPFTQQFSNVVGDITSFIWASYAGLWHIHNTGNILADLSSTPNWKKIENHLGKGAPDQRGFDIKKISERKWSDHQEQFSNFIMMQAAILYEEWCQSLTSNISTSGGAKLNIKAESFQFPSCHQSKKFSNWSELDTSGCIKESSFLKSEIQPALITKYKENIKHIDNLLHWYRYFKGLRNSIVHHGSIIQSTNLNDYNNAIKTSLVDSGISRNYSGSSPVVGQKITVTLSDAVLLLGIIIRIAYGFDAKYCHTHSAEMLIEKRIRDAIKTNIPPINVSEHRKNVWLKHFLLNSIYINPANLENAEAWLKSKKLIDIKVF